MGDPSNEWRFVLWKITYLSEGGVSETSLETSEKTRYTYPRFVLVICTNKYNGFIRPRVFAVPPNTTVEDLGNSLREIEGEEYRDKLCKLQEHYWNKLCELEGQEYRNVFRELEKLKRLNKPTDANFLMVVGQSHGLRDTDLLVTLDEHRSADGYLHLEYLDSILDRLCDTNLPGIAEVLASEVLASDRWLPALPEESEPEESEPED